MERRRASIDWHETTVNPMLINVTAPHLSDHLKNVNLLYRKLAGILLRRDSVQIHQFLIIVVLVAEVSARDTERWFGRLMKPVSR